MRFLQQQTFKPDAVVPNWMCSFGTANLLAAEWDHPTQTCFLDLQEPQLINVPRVLPRADIEGRHLATMINESEGGQTRIMIYRQFSVGGFIATIAVP